jgi:CRP-like cAMP-binding protein
MIEFIKKITLLPIEQENAINQVIKSSLIHKGDFLLSEGSICKALYWINTGLLRHYHNYNGNQLTTCFSTENDLAHITSFFTRSESKETIEALEDTTISFILHEDLLKLYEEFPSFQNFGRLIAEREIHKIEELLLLLFTPISAELRFKYFTEQYPSIIKRVPQHQIASFLRMNQSTYSRIRAGLKY